MVLSSLAGLTTLHYYINGNARRHTDKTVTDVTSEGNRYNYVTSQVSGQEHNGARMELQRSKTKSAQPSMSTYDRMKSIYCTGIVGISANSTKATRANMERSVQERYRKQVGKIKV